MGEVREFLTVFARLTVASEKLTEVIPWACPVPYFGELDSAQVATVGLNPSNLEFVDAKGVALGEVARRFPTLEALQLANWELATPHHARLVESACATYFRRNPYDRWFKPLDYLLSSIGASYYFPGQGACHLDLVPYATTRKWGELSTSQKAALTALSSDVVARLVQQSTLHTLVLNGKAVVRLFEAIAGTTLDCQLVDAWSLPRRNGMPVPGYSYQGTITTLAGLPLGRPVRVLGYNHNVQSSFGVTSTFLKSLRNWIAQHAIISQ
ncbi:MAG: hypothetical protein EOO60_03540 [Hymenobacter sp.]|nr:MAG: hypothetical protein EOO60_03540 [Hymenobacter sp.]